MEEKRLKELMKESRMEMPFLDFEDQVMASIHKEEQSKKGILKNIRLSWVFFTLGTLFGIIATTAMPLIKKQLFNLDITYLQMPVTILLVGVLLWQMDAMLKLTFKKKKL